MGQGSYRKKEKKRIRWRKWVRTREPSQLVEEGIHFHPRARIAAGTHERKRPLENPVAVGDVKGRKNWTGLAFSRGRLTGKKAQGL